MESSGSARDTEVKKLVGDWLSTNFVLSTGALGVQPATLAVFEV